MINSVADLHRQISVRCMSSARMEFSKGMNRPIGSGSVKRKASPLKYMVMLENGGWDRFPSVTMYSNGSNLMLDADADARFARGCVHGIVTKTADKTLVGWMGLGMVGCCWRGGGIMTLCYEIDPLCMA